MFGFKNSKAAPETEGARPSTELPRSPCTAVCAIDPISGYCEGCLRTIDEIGAWRFMRAEAKQAVLDNLKSRRIPGADNGDPKSEDSNDATVSRSRT
ncbi:MAG: DUF1289 domain-containing protein [Leptospirales bacterium]|jgi:predicted Fe-S protein YdhL (DUF1289 family)